MDNVSSKECQPSEASRFSTDFPMLASMISQAEVISFDFFDTLFIRPLMDPEDAFDILGRKFGIENFRQHRRSAQAEAFRRMHKNGRKEITLEGIYACFSASSSTPADSLMQAEFELELELVHPNKEMQELFQQALSAGKKVILTSDMYLPAVFFERALNRHNLYQVPLYISSDKNATKRDFGELFDVISSDLGVAHERILHIGDNRESDFNKAVAKGLKAFHYQATRQPLEIAHSAPEASLARGMSRKHFADLPPGSATELGFLYGGPAAVAFLDWIGVQAKKDGIDKVLFLARDGYCLDLIARSRNDADFPDFHYFMGSRTVFTLAAMTDSNFMEFMPFLISGAKGLSCFEILERIGVVPPSEEFLKEIGLNEKIVYDIDNSVAFEEFLYAYRWEILKVCQRNRRALFMYLRQLGIHEGSRVALVDVGWNGTTQEAFELAIDKMIDIDVFGYYFCLSNLPICLEKKKNRQMYDIFSTSSVTQEIIQKIYDNRVGVELFFSAPHRTVIGLGIASDNTVFAIEDMRGDDSACARMSEEFTRGITLFANSFESIRKRMGMQTSPVDLAMPLVEFVTNDNWNSHQVLQQVINFDAWSYTRNRHAALDYYKT